MKSIIIVLLLSLGSLLSYSQDHVNDITGEWISKNKEMKVKIYKKADLYFGKVVWLHANNKHEVQVGDIIIKSLSYNPENKKYEEGEFVWGDRELDCELILKSDQALELNLSKYFFSKTLNWNKI